MSEIVQNQPGDLPSIITAANLTFGDNVQPGGFSVLLPKLYGPNAPHKPNHLLIKEGDEIKSLVLSSRGVMSVLGTRLKFAGIGTVSVTPDARGKGYMQELMTATVAQLKAEGCAFSVLGGNRQRYEYFGYYLGGSQWDCVLTPQNVKHALDGVDCSDISLVPMTEGHPLLAEATELHNSTPCHVVRDEDGLFDLLRSWRGEPYFALRGEKLMGIFTLLPGDEQMQLIESDLYDDTQFTAICKAIVERLSPKGIKIELPLWKQKQLAVLEPIGEHITLQNNHNYLIFDFVRVIDAFLKLKYSYQRLSNGCVDLSIDGRCMRIMVVGGNAAVVELSAHSTVTLALTAREATSLLFSQLSTPRPTVMPTDWFPLPIMVPSQDCC